MRRVIPHLVMCPVCNREYEPLTRKPAPEPDGTPVQYVTYRMCSECLVETRRAKTATLKGAN